MEAIIEKPAPEQAPSTLAQIGRFVLTSEIVDILEDIHVSTDKELYLTDAIAVLCHGQRVLVHPIEGQWLTTGDPMRFLMANVEYALKDPEIGPDFARYLKSLKLPPS